MVFFFDQVIYSFLELISENNTLPAYLYSIGSDQSIGLLYNSKELLYVVKGGKESTSFDYFRSALVDSFGC
jgi:hypothetical protein